MRSPILMGALFSVVLLGADPAIGGPAVPMRFAPRVAERVEHLVLLDAGTSRGAEARLRAVGPHRAVTFERSAVVLEPAQAQGSQPVRVRIDFPASPGLVALDAGTAMAVDATGRDWRERAAAYRELRYRDIAPSTDLVCRARAGRLAYQVVVAPGGNLSVVRLRYRGVTGLATDSDGGLRIETSAGAIHEQPPVLFQEVDGRRVLVTGGYRVVGNELGFWAGAHDPSLPLVVEITEKRELGE